MKKSILLISLIIFVIAGLGAKNIQAYLSYASFHSPADGPYLETYLSIYAKSIVFVKNTNGKFQGAVGVTMIFKQGKEIRNFKKYELKSPEIDDTTKLDFSFIDEQRILLPNGEYNYEFQIADNNTKAQPTQIVETLKIDYPPDKLNISGIQLIESYKKADSPGILTKSGYDIVPYIYNFYPKNMNKLAFYAEIYNADKVLGPEGKYLLSYYIQSNETRSTLTDYVKNRKEMAKPVGLVFDEFDISKLPSGNYNLNIEIHNQLNEIIASNSLFFQRSNPDIHMDIKDIAALEVAGTFAGKITNRDTLAEFIRSTTPISSEMEKAFIRNQLKTMDLLSMQQYFLNFWEKRDNLNPERAWLAYNEQVKIVDASFKNPNRKGYDTDRGRIYLRYGAPNTITDEPFDASGSGMYINGSNVGDGYESAPPYQIWHYYVLTKTQRDKKFVFANSHLAAGDYTLVHSNVQGEINNPNWQAELNRNTSIWDKDEIAPDGKYRGKSGDLYNNPR